MTPQNENFGEKFFSPKLPEKQAKSENSPKNSPKMAQNDQKRPKNESFGQNFFFKNVLNGSNSPKNSPE